MTQGLRQARRLGQALLLASASLAAQAQIGGLPDFIPNYAALGIASTTRYSGSDERVAIAGPLARYDFGGSRYLLELTGPLLDLNLSAKSDWRFGPSLNLRFGRSDVEDPVLQQLPEIKTTVELGAYLAWVHINPGPVPWVARVSLHVLRDVGNVSEGWTGTLGGSVWLPLSASTFVGLGAGLGWADGAFMNTYYGIDGTGSAASGLPAYRPAGGFRQWYAWPTIIHRLDPRWFVGAGLLYQSLEGAAGDSPVVRERGQLSYGVGIGYAFK